MDCGREVKKRVQARWSVWRRVAGVICDRRAFARTKGKVYKTLVRPATLDNVETKMLIKKTRGGVGGSRVENDAIFFGSDEGRIRNVYVRRRLQVESLGTQ